METRTKGQALLLAVLVALLGGVLYWNLAGDSPPVVAAKPPATGVKARPGAAPSFAAPPDVSLQALEQPRPDPAEGDRNPFRFKPKAPPPPPPAAERAQGQESGPGRAGARAAYGPAASGDPAQIHRDC